MTPLRASARRCSSAALGERKPSSAAISARVGGEPVRSIVVWTRSRICCWRAVSFGGDLPVVQRAVLERLFSVVPFADSPMKAWLDAVGRFLSPYDFNPLNINPLKELIERYQTTYYRGSGPAAEPSTKLKSS